MQVRANRTIRRNLIFFFTLTFSTLYAAEPVPRSMAAVGDSITAGALAGFNRTDGLNPLLLPKFIYHIGKIGFMRSLKGMESRGRSWSTGTANKVGTHARYFQYLNGGKKLELYNAAVSGANSNHIADQISAVLNWSRKNGEKAPDYVTIEIGANDACSGSNASMTPVATYARNLESAVNRLLQADSETKIMIAGIPNLEHLRDMARNSIVTGIGLVPRCQDMWNLHKFCGNMLREPSATKRREITDRVRAYMSAASEVARAANAKFGADQVRFSRAVFDYKFNDKEISLDCFHPNWRGQQALSNVMWWDSWWSQ